jgi:hypothetical protein
MDFFIMKSKNNDESEEKNSENKKLNCKIDD